MANKSYDFSGGTAVAFRDVELDGTDGLLTFIDHDFDRDELIVQFVSYAGFLTGKNSDFWCGHFYRIAGIGYVGNFNFDRVGFCGGAGLVCDACAAGLDGKMTPCGQGQQRAEERDLQSTNFHVAKLVSGWGCLKLFMEFCDYRCCIRAGDEHGFAATFVASDEGHGARREAKRLGDELEQGFVGGGVHGRRGDADFELLGDGVGDDFVPRGARLEADVERHALGGFLDVFWQRHSGRPFEVTNRSLPSRE